MNTSAQKTEWLVWGLLVAIIVAIVGVFAWSRLHGKPPPLVGLTISDFALTNQNNELTTPASLRGKVFVADIIFTRCPGPCLKMTRHLAEFQASLPAGNQVLFLTLTSDPEFDTPPVLKRYAERFKTDSSRWSFVTGPKTELRRLAINDFKFVAIEKKPAEQESADDLFIHSTWFTLVDQQGRVRGWTDSTGSLHAYFDSEDPAALAELRLAIQQLVRYPGL